MEQKMEIIDTELMSSSLRMTEDSTIVSNELFKRTFKKLYSATSFIWIFISIFMDCCVALRLCSISSVKTD